MDEPEKIFPEREAATYPTNEKTTQKRAEVKKGGKRNHLPVVVRSTREKMTGSGVSGLYEIAEGYGITTCVTFFLPRGVQVYFLLFLDALKSGS